MVVIDNTNADISPCPTERDYKLYRRGKLGVAISADICRHNIQRMIDDSERYFLAQDWNTVRANPWLAERGDNMAYSPGSGREVLEVTIKSPGTIEEKEQRALRILAHRILVRKATHGTDYRVERSNGTVTMSAVPIILTRRM